MSFTLDPDLAAVLTESAGEPAPPLVAGDWQTWRDAVAATYPALTADFDRPDLDHRVFETTAEDGAAIDLHWFAPRNDGSSKLSAAVIHAHGGALVAGEVSHFAPFLERYVVASGVPILSVDYRLAPEVRGAIPARDVYVGLTWLRANAQNLSVDPARIALMGESAGSTLAAGAAIMARDAGTDVAKQILIYPMLDNADVPLDAHLEPYAADLHTLKSTGWMSLLGENAHSSKMAAEVVPARLADPTGLPATYLEVGELDAFRDETVTFAQRLWAAGVTTELHVLPGLVHGWDHFAPNIAVHQAVFARRVAVLQSL